jgi:hypothetical protein
VPTLDLRFSYLNQKFLVYSYARGGDALRGELKTLADLGSGKNMRGYPLNLADQILKTDFEHIRVY